MNIESLGFVEICGAVASIVVADAMVKASQVRILSESRLDPGLLTIVVEGDLGACVAAVEAGARAARAQGCLVATLVKGKPDPAIEALFQPAPRTPAPAAVPPAAPGADAAASPRLRRAAAPPAPTVPDAMPGDAVVAFVAAAPQGRTLAALAAEFKVGLRTARGWVRVLVAQGRLERFNRGVRRPSGPDPESGTGAP